MIFKDWDRNQVAPLSITGICKSLPSCIICNASRIVVSNVAQSGLAVITWKCYNEVMSTGSVKATGQLRQWEKENCKYNGILEYLFY